MKKLLAVILLTLAAVPAMAQYHHHHGHWQRGYGGPSPWVWVAPTVIGGVIGYEIARNQPPVIVQQQPAPVVIQQQPGQNCSPWTEIQNPDGTITRTRTCNQ